MILIITIEENTCFGGAGSGVAEYLLAIGKFDAHKNHGITR